MNLSNHYNVIIIGAGIAGQSCAKNLINTQHSVLLIESNPNFQNKACAGGLTEKDKKYISKKYYKQPPQKGSVFYNDQKELTNQTVITPISRSKYLKEGVEEIKRSPNINIHIPGRVLKVSNHSITLEDGKVISFDYLVGADGTFSIVRKYLKLEKSKLWIGIQYRTENRNKKDVSEIHLDKDTPGYYWIFPRGDYCSVGIWSLLDDTTPEKLRKKLDSFIENHNLNKLPNSISSGVVNSVYSGYKFGNIFLAGDAAGLTPGLTGEGIYPALLSGKVIAQEIIQERKDTGEMRRHLVNKYTMDTFAKLLNNSYSRNIFFKIGIRMFKSKFWQKIILRVASS